jgi:transcription elongation factor GreA
MPSKKKIPSSHKKGSQTKKLASKSEIAEDKVLLTAEGLAKLKEELEYLKKTKRKEVAERLQEAISYGDLSENSEYEEAKNEQAFCEGRIAELEKMIKNAQLIDDEKAHRTVTVRIGTTVVIKELETKEASEKMSFTIVGSTEADPFAARISNESPVGRALIGLKKGEKFMIEAPGGQYQYELLEIK